MAALRSVGWADDQKEVGAVQQKHNTFRAILLDGVFLQMYWFLASALQVMAVMAIGAENVID
jgi:hypothetical protein